MLIANTAIPTVSANTPLFGLFPTIQYDINSTIGSSGSTETVTDIFFRFSILRNIVYNTSSYYVYNISDTDTPEVLAEQVYNDRGAGWIILYANQIFDAQFDWPLNYDAFKKMIIDKYGSVEQAQETIHHCEMTITRTNQFFGTSSTTNFVIDTKRKTNQVPGVAYAYFKPWTAQTYRTSDSDIFTADDYERPFMTADLTYDDLETITRSGSIPTIKSYQTFEIDDKTITVTVDGQSVSMYDYELQQNDKKRLIKIVKQEYYPQIMNEFKNITKKQPRYLLGF